MPHPSTPHNALNTPTTPSGSLLPSFLCSDRASSVITIKVIDDRDFLKDPIVGYMSVKLDDLLAAKKEAGRDWWPLSGCQSGRIRLGVEWKPLNMAGSLHGADRYVPPIGVIRVHLQKATDVKCVTRFLLLLFISLTREVTQECRSRSWW
jgi:Ca2+-dependent lipid-binding protein